MDQAQTTREKHSPAAGSNSIGERDRPFGLGFHEIPSSRIVQQLETRRAHAGPIVGAIAAISIFGVFGLAVGGGILAAAYLIP